MLSGDVRSLVQHYGKSVITTWDLVFQTLARDYPTAAELLLYLGFLHHTNIPQELFQTAYESLDTLSSQDRLDLCSEHCFPQVLLLLSSFSLVLSNLRHHYESARQEAAEEEAEAARFRFRFQEQ